MIRKATVEDVEVIFEMLERYYHENQRKKADPIQFVEEIVKKVLTCWLSDPLGIVYMNDHGVVIGRMGATWFGGDPLAEELVLYVDEEYRNGLLARQLLRRFAEEAKARGALAVCGIMMNGMDVERTEKFFLKLGYEKHGTVVIKRLYA